MFFSKKAMKVNIYDNNGLIWTGPTTELPIKDSVIIRKSIEYFDDPEPCFIHRKAVMQKIIFEIEDAVNSNSSVFSEVLGFLNLEQAISIEKI